METCPSDGNMPIRSQRSMTKARPIERVLKPSKAYISSLLSQKQMSYREQVRKKRQVLEPVVVIIKVIGKCGLNDRGDRHEAAYTLEDVTLDHSNCVA